MTFNNNFTEEDLVSDLMRVRSKIEMVLASEEFTSDKTNTLLNDVIDICSEIISDIESNSEDEDDRDDDDENDEDDETESDEHIAFVPVESTRATVKAKFVEDGDDIYYTRE